jgi:transglutaminase-like putative cysteine protease
VIYKIRHLTAYSYEQPVAFATLALRLTPLDTAIQRRLDSKITISPAPATVARDRDFYGNAVETVTINSPHTELVIVATARVEVVDQPRLPASDAPWENVAADALASRDLSGASPTHFLFSSPRIALNADVTDYARRSFPAGRGVIEACRDLMTRIKADFVYKPQATDITTPLAEAFAQRRGVCQDFAHIMIAGLRGLGVPAAYVSGYLRTVPPVGKQRLQGADATHAWVSVWTGAHDGWTGFDPTNGVQTNTDHIRLAVGRDFSDVSPVYGVFIGSGENKLRVEVDVIPTPAKTA